jgi:hypothetical protein
VSLFLRPSRLLGIRLGRSGVRWSVGPHWLRLQTGGRGDGAGTLVTRMPEPVSLKDTGSSADRVTSADHP